MANIVLCGTRSGIRFHFWAVYMYSYALMYKECECRYLQMAYSWNSKKRFVKESSSYPFLFIVFRCGSNPNRIESLPDFELIWYRYLSNQILFFYSLFFNFTKNIINVSFFLFLVNPNEQGFEQTNTGFGSKSTGFNQIRTVRASHILNIYYSINLTCNLFSKFS